MPRCKIRIQRSTLDIGGTLGRRKGMCRTPCEQERRKRWCHCLTKEVSLLMNYWQELNSAACVPWVESWWIKDLIWFMVSTKTSNKDVIMRSQQGGGTGSCGLGWWGLHWEGAVGSSPGSFHQVTVWYEILGIYLRSNTELNASYGLSGEGMWHQSLWDKFGLPN